MNLNKSRYDEIRGYSVDLNELANKSLEEYCDFHFGKYFEELFLRKHIDFKDSLVVVFIGDRFPDGMLPSLAFHCNELNVPCYRIYWSKGKPHILFPGSLSNDGSGKYDKLGLNPNA